MHGLPCVVLPWDPQMLELGLPLAYAQCKSNHSSSFRQLKSNFVMPNLSQNRAINLPFCAITFSLVLPDYPNLIFPLLFKKMFALIYLSIDNLMSYNLIKFYVFL